MKLREYKYFIKRKKGIVCSKFDDNDVGDLMILKV